MSNFIKTQIPIYDNGRSQFYLVGKYRDEQNRSGTNQLKTIEGRPKMFRLASTYGSGHYYKSLSDALHRAHALGCN